MMQTHVGPHQAASTLAGDGPRRADSPGRWVSTHKKHPSQAEEAARTQPAEVAPSPSSTLWVGNIPLEATNKDLQDLVGSAGSCKVISTERARESGRLHGFINLPTPQAAARVKSAIEGHKLCGSTLGLEVRFRQEPSMQASAIAW